MVLNTEWAQVEVIDLINDGNGLAFGIIGGRSTGVVVKTILPGGVADRDGRLQSGDHILQIGEVNLRGLGSEQVASVLRQCGVHVRMVVARPVESTAADLQAAGSHAPIVPTKFIGDPLELDRYLVENGYEGAFAPPPVVPYSPVIYGGPTPELHLHAISGMVDVVRDPLPIGKVPAVVTIEKSSPAAQVVPSTPEESRTDSPETEIFAVQLRKDDLGLGITVAGYVCEREEISGIFVKSISKGGAADLDRRIKINDRIIEVDGTSVIGFTNHQAVEKLRHTGNLVKIKLERYLRGPKYEKLQQAIKANEMRSPSPPSATASSLPKVPLSLVHMSHLGIEPEDISRTSFDFDSAILLDSSPVNEDHEIVIGGIRRSLEASISSRESMFDKWREKFPREVQIVIAQMHKANSGLGISLEGTVDVEDGKEVRPHHYIRNILPDGPVGRNGVLQSGDELLEVNGTQLLGLNHLEVVSILKQLPSFVCLVCARYPIPMRVIDTSQDPLAFQARNILAESLQNLMQPGDQNLLLKAKSELSLISSIGSDVGNSRSRSLEFMAGLPMWSEEQTVVELIKGDHGLGFSILDYQDPLDPNQTVIVIRSLVPGGVAQSDGRLIPGDRLLGVNDVNLAHVTLDVAVNALKGAPRGVVKILVAKPLNGRGDAVSHASQLVRKLLRQWSDDIGYLIMDTTEDSTTRIEEFQECAEEFQDYLDAVHISMEDEHSFNHSACSSQVEDFGTKNTNIILNHVANDHVNSNHFLDKNHTNTNHFFADHSPRIITNHLLGDHNHFLETAILVNKKETSKDSFCDSDAENSFKSTSEHCLDKNLHLGKDDNSLNMSNTNYNVEKAEYCFAKDEEECYGSCIEDMESEGQNKLLSEVENIDATKNCSEMGTQQNVETEICVNEDDVIPVECEELISSHSIRFDIENIVESSAKDVLEVPAPIHTNAPIIKPEQKPVGVQVNLPMNSSEPCLKTNFFRCCHHICLDSRLDHMGSFDGATSEEDEFFLIECPADKAQEVTKSISEPNVLETYQIPVSSKLITYKLKEYYNDYESCLNELDHQDFMRNSSKNDDDQISRSELTDSQIFNEIFLPFKSSSAPNVMDKSFVTLTYDPGPDLDGSRRKSAFVGGAMDQNNSEMTVICRSESRSDTMKDTHSGQLHNHWGSTHVVRVYKEPQKSLGISIVGGKVDVDSSEKKAEASVLGIFIKNIVANSPAGKTGLLKTGDRILEVSGIDLRHASHNKAVEAIKNSANPVVFVVQSLVPWESSENVNTLVNNTSPSSRDRELSPPLSKKVIENHDDAKNYETFNDIGRPKRTESVKVTFGGSSFKPDSDQDSRPTTPRTPTPLGRERIDSGSEDEEDDEEDTAELEGRTVSAKGQQIDRASAANVRRSKDEISADPDVEDDFGYTTNKVKKKYGNLGHSVLMVQLERSHAGLGLSLAGHKDRSCMAVFVCGLNPNGAAFKSGLIEIGDEILEVNGVVLHGRCHLNASAIIKSLSGPVFKVIILRRKAAIDDIAVKPITQFPVSLAEEASEEFFSTQYPNVRSVAIKKPSNQSLGIMIIEGKHAEVGQGIFISDIQEGSSAEKAGLEIGEMILAVNKDSLVGANYDQAASLLKRTEGLVTLVVSSPTKSKDANRASTPQANNIAANHVPPRSGLKTPSGPSRSATPVPEPPPDPLTCSIIPGKETAIEINSDNKSLGVFFVGGKDTAISEGIVISDILPGGAAEKDGRLQPGDQILEVNGASLRSASNTAASQALRQTLPKMKILIYRPSRVEFTSIEVDLVKKPGKGLGLSFMPRKAQKGVFISDIISGGLAEADGRVALGDIIVSVNGTNVEGMTGEEAGSVLKTAQGKVSLKLNRYKVCLIKDK